MSLPTITARTAWLAVVLAPVFVAVTLAWGIGAALVLTPAVALLARSVALVVTPQLARRVR
ncbi:MAG TPA: hypothetical protein VGF46_06350 [Gaiellales bacterium]|jgi:hypothetical protein